MNYHAIGRNVRHYRRLREWTSQDLSKATGLSLRFIERLEDGAHQKVHPITIERVADALIVGLDDLLSQDEPPEPPPPLPRSMAMMADVFSTGIALVVLAVVALILLVVATYARSILSPPSLP
jgi:transcriptional regulator with XRE-family HTH domain